MIERYATFPTGLMVPVKPPRISAKRWDELSAAFLSLVAIDDEGHWRFEGQPSPVGRAGCARINGQDLSLRWFSWAIFHGEIPEGFSLKGRCGGSSTGNPCLNHEHFYLQPNDEPPWYCRRGHLFTDETLLVDEEKGTRRCLTCRPLPPAGARRR